jgi:hypothetical protein
MVRIEKDYAFDGEHRSDRESNRQKLVKWEKRDSKMLPSRCSFFHNRLTRMGLEFSVHWQSRGALHSGLPIAGPALAMGHRKYLDFAVSQPVDQAEGKPGKKIAQGSGAISWPPVRGLGYSFNGMP